jgi:4'-phosphopantetheinyl transferase
MGQRTSGSLGTALSPVLSSPPRFWLRPLAAATFLSAELSAEEQQWCAQLPAAIAPRYAWSRRWMRHCLAELLACSPALVPLCSPPGQAPRLEQRLGWLSLSHSGDQLLLAWSLMPIGVDLEWGQRSLQAESLARRFFPAEEYERLLSLPAALRRRAFLESWVRKEAAIKWQGNGRLAADLAHWCWDDSLGTLRHDRAGWRPPVVLREREGWLCAAVGHAVDQGIWS